jgi:hypothetical protein
MAIAQSAPAISSFRGMVGTYSLVDVVRCAGRHCGGGLRDSDRWPERYSVGGGVPLGVRVVLGLLVFDERSHGRADHDPQPLSVGFTSSRVWCQSSMSQATTE